MRGLRVLFGLSAALAALAAAGSAYEWLAERHDRAVYPPPGRLVDAGGHRLHLRIEGADRPGPTVILECGIGGATSNNWGWIEPAVARFAPVVAYDRAGLGWSDPGPLPRDGRRIVAELHLALANAGLHGPYVFVGHSYGGLLARVFTDAYPDEVAGLVLAEPSHPALFERAPAFGRMVRWMSIAVAAAPVLASFGVVRLLLPLVHTDADVLPPAEGSAQRAFLASPAHWRGVAAELPSWRRDTSPEAAVARDFADRPLIVLTAGVHGARPGGWVRLQSSTAALSSDHAQRLVPGATHGSIVNDRRYAVAITEAIRQVVAAVRTGGRIDGGSRPASAGAGQRAALGTDAPGEGMASASQASRR
jgi:pimeloyl-ACP methyl ester carboxylesterase